MWDEWASVKPLDPNNLMETKAVCSLSQNTVARALGIASCCLLTFSCSEQLFPGRAGWCASRIELEGKGVISFLDFKSVSRQDNIFKLNDR